MRRIYLVLITIFVASPAFAAGGSVLVSAGEHNGYSRIAFETNGSEVTVAQNGRTVRLLNLNPSVSFDLKNINDRRKAYRILNAKIVQTQSGKDLELTLTCDCAVRSSVLDNGKFILDVLDSAPAPKAVEPTATTAQTQEPPKTLSREEQSAERAAERIGTPPSQEDILSVAQARNQMVELLKQAASEGLITIKGDNTAAAPSKSTHKKNLPDSRIIMNLPDSADPTTTVSVDDAPALPTPITNASLNSPGKGICQPDGMFLIDGADFVEDPLIEISTLQALLADEEDSNRVDVVQKLVAGLLSIGFGEEALALLTDNGRQDSIRADVARIIAERDLPTESPLRTAKNCQGAHALWQAVISEPERTNGLYQRSGAAIEMLPHRLRALIATRIAINLVAAEAWDSAEKLYEVAMADVEHPGPDLEFVRARLDQRLDDPEAARDTLLRIAAGNSNSSADALLALADSYAKNEATPHEGFTEDIGALAKLGGSSQAMLAEAGAWARLGNVNASLFLLRSVGKKSRSDLQSARKSAQTVFDDVFTSDDEQTLAGGLDAFLQHKEWFAPDQRAVETRLASANTSQEFGLPNLALSLLNEIKNRDDKQYLKAKATAALTAGVIAEAIRTAAPLSADPSFGEIIVDANVRNGDYDSAIAAAANIADSTLNAAWTSRAAWLARSWKTAAVGFRALDPNMLNENTALQFALTAYKVKEQSLPSAAEAVLSQENTSLTEGLRSIFAEPPEGTALQRSQQQVESSSREIQMIQEILNNG